MDWGINIVKNRFFNSIALKLLLVNMVAPLVLIGGMFLIGNYQKAMEDSEFKNIETQAKLIAVSFNKYWDVMEGIGKLSELRAQIYANNGALMADSKVEEDGFIPDVDDLIAVLTEGHTIKDINYKNNTMRIFIPVYAIEEEIKGAVLVYASTEDLQQRITEIKYGLYSLSLITLFLTIILSLFFAKKLITPINALAEIATQIQDREKPIEIPNYTKRHDEIGMLSVAFNVMLENINNKLQMFENFASDVTHEIKNPLTSILSAIETVQKIDDNEKREKLFNIIFDDVKRLDKLITDISSVSKLSAEIDDERLEKIAIFPLLKKLVQVYELNDKNQKIIINSDNAIKDVKIMAKDTRISQIFNNLISNAMSFSDENSEIIIDLKVSGKILLMSVIDSGKGISQGDEEKIFQRFYKDREAGQANRHSGLGLSLTKIIVENLGGKIYASHNQPKGAVLTVELPVFQKKR